MDEDEGRINSSWPQKNEDKGQINCNQFRRMEDMAKDDLLTWLVETYQVKTCRIEVAMYLKACQGPRPIPPSDSGMFPFGVSFTRIEWREMGRGGIERTEVGSREGQGV